MAVSAFFMALAAWLYLQEGPYIKSMDLYIVPQKGQFEIEVLSDGKKAEVFALEKGIKLLTDQKKVDGKQRLLINGEVISEQGESFVQIRIVSDCENPKEG